MMGPSCGNIGNNQSTFFEIRIDIMKKVDVMKALRGLMDGLLATLLLLGLTLGAAAQQSPATSAGQAAAPAEAALGSPAKPLAGAIWVPCTGANFRDPLKIDGVIDELKNLSFGDLLIQVRNSCDAYYNSAIVPKAMGLPERYDPLAVMIGRLKKEPRPRRVIAWIAPYLAANENSATPLDPRHALTAHPDWLSVRADGSKRDAEGRMYLEAGHPEVQAHLEMVVAELVKNYDLDGLIIDPMGEPNGDPAWGFHPQVLIQWQQQTGRTDTPGPDDPAWAAFRAQIFQQALAGLVHAAHQAKPDIPVGVGAEAGGSIPSAEAFNTSEVFARHHQNWPEWMRQGLVDRIYLKNFQPEETAAAIFDGWTNLALALEQQTRVPVVVGVGGRQNESVMSLAQLRRAAEAGASGVALCDFVTPATDSGSRMLLFNAIGRTIFAPRLRDAAAGRPARITLPPIKAQQRPKFADAFSTEPLMETPEPTPMPKAPPTEMANAPAAAPPAVGSDVELPPPPVLDEGDGNLLPALPGGGGAAKPPATQTAPANTDPNLQALQQLAGTLPPDQDPSHMLAQAPSDGQPTTNSLTHNDMLMELLKDPQLAESRAWSVIRPSEKARSYLKQNFQNIFD